MSLLLLRVCMLLALPVLLLATFALGPAIAGPRATHRSQPSSAIPQVLSALIASEGTDPQAGSDQPTPGGGPGADAVAANDGASATAGTAGASSESQDHVALSVDSNAAPPDAATVAAEDHSWMDVWQQGTPAPPRSAVIPVLMYHHVAPIDYSRANSIEADLTVLPAEFEKQMSYMRSQGYNTISLREVWNYFQGGKPLPPKAVVLTFDDGYDDVYKYALPLLSKYGLRGTFFMITGLMGQPRYMNQSQVWDLFRAGMEIGAHSSIHPSLPTLMPARLTEELVPPRKYLELVTGVPVLALAYPSGAYDQNVLEATRQAGYRIAVTTKYGATQQRDRLLEMVRVRVHGAESLATFSAELSRYYPAGR